MNSAFKETKVHGKPDFPYEVYNTYIPKHFTYFPMHWHEQFEIIYVIEGHLKVTVEGKEFICEPDDIVIVPPDHIHDMGQVDSEPSHYANIMFNFSLLEPDSECEVYKKYFEPFFKNEISEFVVKAGSELGGKLVPLAKDMYECRHEKYSTDELRVKSDLYEFMYRIQGLIQDKSEASETRENWIEKIKPVLTYVSQNLAEEISVEQAAEKCGLSKSHFMKIFKNVTGNSFLDYVKRCRLENAYYLLTETVKNVSEIGEESGFSNFSYFIRSFKETYGMSPLQFRKKFAENKKQSFKL